MRDFQWMEICLGYCMNNEQQTYVLKRPINAWPNFDSNEMVVELENDDYRCSLEAFNEDFVPLDVSGLTRQVEESLTFLCQYAYDAGYTTGDDRTVTGKDVDLSVKTTALKIVGLLLNQEKETK